MKATVSDIKHFVSEFTSDFEFISENCSSVVYKVPHNLTKYFVKCLKFFFKEVANVSGTPVCTLVDVDTLKITLVW